MHAYGGVHSIAVKQNEGGVQVIVTDASGKVIHDTTLPEGQIHTIVLPE
jgi:hypothetical protein